MPPKTSVPSRRPTKEEVIDELDFSKRDNTVVYGNRTFALWADRERREKSKVIIENRTPIGHWLLPASDPATCSPAGGGFVAATVDTAGGHRVGKR